MNKIVTAVCAVVLLLILHCDKCVSLETSEDVKSDHRLLEIEEENNRQKPVRFLLKWKGKVVDDANDSLTQPGENLKRVTRQTYQGHTQIYPNLPSGSPYGQQPYPNYNNQNSNGYTPNNFNSNPPGPYGQNSNSNQWQNNGQPNYNNPYGSNTQLAHNNYTQPGYPNVNGYKPSNFTPNYPSGPYGQNSNTNAWPHNGQPGHNPYGTQLAQNNYTQPGHNPSGTYGQSTPPNSWHNPYSSNNGQRPYNSSVVTPYPGYKPTNTYNNPTGRPPYSQYGQNSSYITTPRPYNTNPSYYPGQSYNNTRPGGQHSVIYDESTKRPGQNPYNTYNASNWPGTTLNSTRPYNPQNGQNLQYPYSYPGSPGYAQNSSSPYNQRPPYQGQNFGQNSPNNYGGHSSDSATFNLAGSYNPSIPNRPPYGSPYGNGPYSNGPYGNGSPNTSQYPNQNSQDPTRVSPQHFNSH